VVFPERHAGQPTDLPVRARASATISLSGTDCIRHAGNLHREIIVLESWRLTDKSSHPPRCSACTSYLSRLWSRRTALPHTAPITSTNLQTLETQTPS
jgi:hypothetical protein